MRILSGLFCALLILFAAVQYNDPDGPLWALFYGIGALWCAAAAFKPNIFRSNTVVGIFFACLAAAMAGMVWYWPNTPRFWAQDVWWETETAREGMGMMILLISIIIAGLTLRRSRRE